MSKLNAAVETMIDLLSESSNKSGISDKEREEYETSFDCLIESDASVDRQLPNAKFLKEILADLSVEAIKSSSLPKNTFKINVERSKSNVKKIEQAFHVKKDTGKLEKTNEARAKINNVRIKGRDESGPIFLPNIESGASKDVNRDELLNAANMSIDESGVRFKMPHFMNSFFKLNNVVQGGDGDDGNNSDQKFVQSPALTTTLLQPVSWNKKDEADKWVIQEPFKSDEFDKIQSQLCHSWDFELDGFQKQAILCLHRSQYVFVAAHTSAGKTVVAEYAIALAMAHNTRCFYCSPIKALSNQKYKEFKHTFGDVGLITGDIQLNPDAAILIMTTEILRTMLYNQKDSLSNLEYLIFDEVHYVNDPERGMVWEEVLILIPSSVTLVMLSATVSNAREFAKWVGSSKGQPVHLMTTLHRPVPLVHLAFTGMGENSKDELYLLQSDERRFVRGHYNLVLNAYKRHNRNIKRNRAGYFTRAKNVWITLIRSLEQQQLLPAIGFLFSRQKIDKLATMIDVLNLNNKEEREYVFRFKEHTLRRIPIADRELPQIKSIFAMTANGIGIHHSGLIPIMKEFVENLFSMGLIKMLLATETFAMGVNMPARTVIFSDIEKFDGQEWRNLYPGEYTQMSGRAGRRGIDKTGHVIILCSNELPSFQDFDSILNGKPMPLLSKFKLNFNIILNVERNRSVTVLDMVKSSFGQFAEQCQMLNNIQKLTDLQQQQEQIQLRKNLPTSVYTCIQAATDAQPMKHYNFIHLLILLKHSIFILLLFYSHS